MLRSMFLGILSLTAGIAFSAEMGPSRTFPLTEGIAAFEKAYGDWDGNGFKAAAAMFQQITAENPQSARAFYWQGAAEFHLVLNLLGKPRTAPNSEAANAAMQRAITAVEQALRLDKTDPESHILLSTLYGMKIAENPMRAVWLGPKVMQHRKEALKINPNNPRAHYLAGMSYYHAPELLGGKEEGLAFLLKAEQLFQMQARQSHGPTEPLWGYGSCLTFIGKSYQALNRPEQALSYYRKALAVNPKDFLAQAGLKSLTTPNTGKPAS